MNHILRLAMVLSLGITPFLASAAGIDEKRPMLCSMIQAVECGSGEDECFVGPAAGINLPQFVRVDIKGKKVEERLADGIGRRTVIENSKEKNGKLILQGAEGEYAWSAEIQKDDGKLVLAAAGDEVAFIVFGACIPE